ncbi:hypothetical protein [Polaromonas eurypsychrophila]|uniref:hypothetical protein n=1 Tax=Polaromonas eurypsychrophila TaxID=1614635 RepID=UPI0016669819|nr:hypothetical protein [Polaromonas eurypsychrophila]
MQHSNPTRRHGLGAYLAFFFLNLVHRTDADPAWRDRSDVKRHLRRDVGTNLSEVARQISNPLAAISRDIHHKSVTLKHELQQVTNMLVILNNENGRRDISMNHWNVISSSP